MSYVCHSCGIMTWFKINRKLVLFCTATYLSGNAIGLELLRCLDACPSLHIKGCKISDFGVVW